MSKIDIKNKLVNKYSGNKDLVKVTGMEDLELDTDLFIKQVNAQSRMKMADKAKEYYNINAENVKDIDPNDISAESNFKYIVLMISMTLCDENSELIFENEYEALEILNNFPDNILTNLINQVQNVNAIGETSAKKQLES